MFIKYYYIFLLIILSFLFSLEQVGTSGTMGSVTIDDKLYNQISIRPEFKYGRLGIGLDVYLYFNDDGIYDGNWNFSSIDASYKTIIDKIYYLKWGKRNEDLYFRVGALPNITLGYGILVNKYSNTIQYPDIRRIGLDFIAKLKGRYKINIIFSDFKQSAPGLLGIRVSSSLSSIPRLEWGISSAIDINQNRGFVDHDGDNYPDFFDPYPYDSNLWDTAVAEKDHWKSIYWEITPNPNESNFEAWFDTTSYIGHNEYSPSNYSDIDPVSGVSFDISYRITKNSYIYSQFAQLIGETYLISNEYDNSLGYGVIPIGFHGKYGIFTFNGEYRISSKNFIFNYWDMTYDLNRVSLSQNANSESTDIITKESTLYRYGEMDGLYFNLNTQLFNLISFDFAYQNMKGNIWSDIEQLYIDNNNNSLLLLLNLNTSFLNIIEKAQMVYQQNNVTNPFDFKPTLTTIYGYDLAVRVSNNMLMLYKRRITYEVNGNGDLVEVPTLQIETQMKF